MTKIPFLFTGGALPARRTYRAAAAHRVGAKEGGDMPEHYLRAAALLPEPSAIIAGGIMRLQKVRTPCPFVPHHE